MGYSWTLYTPLPQKDARALVRKVYAELERIVGKDIVATIETEEYPDELGQWPTLDAFATEMPTVDDERALLKQPNKIGVSFEEAALTRLATCKSRIEIERPTGFEDDPTLVTAMILLLRGAGASVFCKNRGFDLTTSETVLEQLEDERDLHTAMIESEESFEEEDEPKEESDATTPEALHRLLQAIAEHPPARRRVGEFLETATPDVQKYVRHLGQHGPNTDAKVAVQLGIDVKAVAKARHALAELLDRAERRR